MRERPARGFREWEEVVEWARRGEEGKRKTGRDRRDEGDQAPLSLSDHRNIYKRKWKENVKGTAVWWKRMK